jgi:hypothetical protein
MKLCDVRVGMLVRNVHDGEVWAVAGVLLRNTSESETPVALEVFCSAYGKSIRDEAYPSQLQPLTEEDL